MSEEFPQFFFICPYVTMRVESAQALDELLALLTVHQGDRISALDWVVGACFGSRPIIEQAGSPTFGHGVDFKTMPTLGEWLDERGIVVE